jgi:hypothetical protein
MLADNTKIETMSWINNGTIQFDRKLDIESLHEEGKNLEFQNNGAIQSEGGTFKVWSHMYSAFINQGDIKVNNIKIKVDDLRNESSGTIEGKTNVSINGHMGLFNHGVVRGKDNDVAGEDGCSIEVWSGAGRVKNYGVIQAGKGGPLGSGGDIYIYSGLDFYNAPRSRIIAAEGNDGGIGGNVNIVSKGRIDNEGGEFQAGWGNGNNGGSCYLYSQGALRSGLVKSGSWISPPAKQYQWEYLPGKIFAVGDTVIVDTTASSLLGFLIVANHFICRLPDDGIKFTQDLFGGDALDIYTTPGGSVDFSETHEQNAVGLFTFTGHDGTINIYSDNVIEPAEGLNFICDPDPNIYPAKSSFIRVMVLRLDEFGDICETGTMRSLIQNQSTIARIFDYSISSFKGWVTPDAGSTSSLQPFAFDSVDVVFTIPGDASFGDVDSVMTIVSIVPDFADTSYSTIVCTGDTAEVTGVLEEKSIVPTMFTLSIYPNPFNSTCKIIAPPNLAIKIFDITGRQVAVLDHMAGKNAGYYVWKPGEFLSSGIFIIQAETEMGRRAAKRVVYLK